LWLCITMLHWTVTNWSGLEACLRSVRWFKVRADLNTLNHLEVIWSTNFIWNICIIQYFLFIINLNKQRSNETLVGVVIWTSDLQDHRWARYQLSFTASLCLQYVKCLIWDTITKFVTVTDGYWSVFPMRQKYTTVLNLK
jgi:hypothetical protein